MDFILALSIVTSASTMLMMWLLGAKKRAGWLISLANQGNWTLLAFLTHAYGLFPLQIMMTYLAIRGWRNWGKSPALANGTRQDKLARIGAIVRQAGKAEPPESDGVFGDPSAFILADLLDNIEEVLHGRLDS